jgi:HSP20 family protein
MTTQTPMTQAAKTTEAAHSGIGSAGAAMATYESSPRVDILETPDEFRAEVELPGVRPEDIDVNLENGILKIQARAFERSSGTLRALVREFGSGTFTRSLRLSESIDAAKISAEVKDGLMTLRLPKVGAVKPRTIPVVSAS